MEMLRIGSQVVMLGMSNLKFLVHIISVYHQRQTKGGENDVRKNACSAQEADKGLVLVFFFHHSSVAGNEEPRLHLYEEVLC